METAIAVLNSSTRACGVRMTDIRLRSHGAKQRGSVADRAQQRRRELSSLRVMQMLRVACDGMPGSAVAAEGRINRADEPSNGEQAGSNTVAAIGATVRP